MMLMYQAYAVANKGQPNEQRELLYSGESERAAREHVRQAISSGFEYGYVKQNAVTIAFLTERSFTI